MGWSFFYVSMRQLSLCVFCCSLLVCYISFLYPLSFFKGRAGLEKITTDVLTKQIILNSSHSSDISFILDVIPAPIPSINVIPLLAVFVRAGSFYLQRCVQSIDYPVQILLIIQDSDDDKTLSDTIQELAMTYAGPDKFIRSILHLVNIPHSGCSQAWNTVFRVSPRLPFWLFTANDVRFPAGELGKFYLRVREDTISDDHFGMASASINFGENNIRRTFGLMTWAVTRKGLLRGGLYDENFFPGLV